MAAVNVLGELLEVKSKFRSRHDLLDYGKSMFDMYTSGGFPPDMFLDELTERVKLTKEEQLFIIAHYQDLFMEHRHKSGIGGKSLAKVRKTNLDNITRFIKTGETGIY